jgi:hypothetical protein
MLLVCRGDLWPLLVSLDQFDGVETRAEMVAFVAFERRTAFVVVRSYCKQLD